MESSANWQTNTRSQSIYIRGAGKSLVKRTSANKYLVLRWNAKQGATSAAKRRKNVLFTPFGKQRSRCTMGRIYGATFAIGTRQDESRKSKNTRCLWKSLRSRVPPAAISSWTCREQSSSAEESAVESSCANTNSYRLDEK